MRANGLAVEAFVDDEHNWAQEYQSSLDSMHFLYVAPRYHTNQHYPVCAVLDAGHEASFIVLRRGRSETYDALEPVVLGCSRTFEVLRRVASWLPGVAYHRFGGLPPLGLFWNEVRKRRPSVVVVREPRSAFGALAVVVTKLVGARLMLYSQTLGRSASSSPGRRWLVKLTGAVWFTPVSDSATIRKAGPEVHYVPFVVPPQTAPEDKNWFEGDAVNLLAIGKFVPRKNHRLFLDALAEVSSSRRIRATIVGECSTEEHCRELAIVRRHCRERGLEDKVEIKLNLPFAEVQSQYPKHDIFVLSSRDEPAAVSPLEAMSHSLPVVCSDSNGTQCYVRHGENGYVFRTDVLDDLVACLDTLIADQARLIDMGRRSYELVVAEHNPQRYVDSIVALAS